MRRLAAMTVLVLMAGLCTQIGRAPASAVGTPFFYVANFQANSVTGYAQGANGNVAPVLTISGSNTALSGPRGIAAEPSTGRLFVANSYPEGTNWVTAYAPGASGNISPVVTISGANTGLDVPEALAFDPVGNLYVGSQTSITVYAPGANGNVAPIRKLTGSNTGLEAPQGFAFDAANNLWVANPFNGVFKFAAGANGNAAPIGTIKGSNTGITAATGIALDRSTGTLFVSDNVTWAVTEYNVNGPLGNVAPIATIKGSNTLLLAPWTLDLDPSGNVYVGNLNGDGSGSIVTYAKGANGNVAPSTKLAGSNTGIVSPLGIFVVRGASRSTTTALTSSQNPSASGQAVTFTATV